VVFARRDTLAVNLLSALVVQIAAALQQALAGAVKGPVGPSRLGSPGLDPHPSPKKPLSRSIQELERAMSPRCQPTAARRRMPTPQRFE
jgi:hypothetical protein